MSDSEYPWDEELDSRAEAARAMSDSEPRVLWEGAPMVEPTRIRGTELHPIVEIQPYMGMPWTERNIPDRHLKSTCVHLARELAAAQRRIEELMSDNCAMQDRLFEASLSAPIGQGKKLMNEVEGFLRAYDRIDRLETAIRAAIAGHEAEPWAVELREALGDER